MALLPRDMETLIDLVENKLSDMLVWDGEDRREIVTLKGCLDELQTMKTGLGNLVAFDAAGKRLRHGNGRASAAARLNWSLREAS